MKRLAVLGVAAGLAFGGALTATAPGGPASPSVAVAASTTSTPHATASAASSTSKPKEPTYNWAKIAIEGVLVLGFIVLGVRTSGIGLGFWGGVGTLLLVFVFGLDPGTPPLDGILIIIAVIGAAAAMEVAGGIDYLVTLADKALRARPAAINYVAPFLSYLLCILTGTAQTFFALIPVINEVAYANEVRPERPLASSTVASTLGITSSPVSAAMALLLPLVSDAGYDLIDVLLITIPSSVIGIIAMSFVMSRHGRELGDDPEYQRRLAAGEVQPPEPAAKLQLKPHAKRSVGIFLGGVLVICIFGIFDGIRPTVQAEAGGTEPLSMVPLIQLVMLTAAALILLTCKVRAGDVPRTPTFQSGMVAMIAIFGVAWMADTFIAANADAIESALGDLVTSLPFMFAIAIFLVAALTQSQSASTRTMIPLGLVLEVSPALLIALWTAVVGIVFLPVTGRQIAVVEADRTGTTRFGKLVINHSFQLPLQIARIVTALVAVGIVSVFY